MAKVVRCPGCGRLVPSASSQCKYCGTAISADAADRPKPAPAPEAASAPEFPDTDKAFGAIASGISSLKAKASAAAKTVQSKTEAAKSAPTPQAAEAPAPKTPKAAKEHKAEASVPRPPKSATAPKPAPAPQQSAPVAPQPEYNEPPKKSGKGMMITIIVLLVLILVGGGVAAVLLLGDKNDKPKDQSTAKDSTESVASKPATEAEEAEEIDPIKHYDISTIISGYPIVVKLEISPEGKVIGKYAYQSTLKKAGDKPSSWFTLSGECNGNDLVLEASNPDYGNFERWEVKLTGEGADATLSGLATNYNTYQYFYVGSKRKPEKYYDPSYNYYDTGEDYMYGDAGDTEEEYEPETL